LRFYDLIRPCLFRLQPETAHHLVATLLHGADLCPDAFDPWVEKHFVDDEALSQELLGRRFPNPVGLGAGFDKNATMIRGMTALGFGFTEIGTVTPLPQPGNPKPRMFRHVEEEAIQNAMGFNNDGMLKVRERLAKVYPYVTPIGVNIGKNKATPETEAIGDYLKLVRSLHTVGDYLVVNISSPNTPGLRDLQNETFIGELFGWAKAITDKPILLKIAPDMSEGEAVDLTALAVEKGADGIIATNTTVDYSLVARPEEIGGISGKPLAEKSFAIFEAVAKELYGKTVLISVGGIDSAEEAYRRIRAGASLVQVLSALVFKGPGLVHDINRGLLRLLEADGYGRLSDAVGADRK